MGYYNIIGGITTRGDMKKLKEDIVKDIEFGILSGFYKTGDRLPAERDLALQFSVSRPVVHESLLILESRGLITMRPRHGVVINDFREKGTLDLLTSLLCHAESGLNPEVLGSLYRVRALMESDAALLAAEKMGEAEFQELRTVINLVCDESDPAELADRDFTIHHLIAKYSGNLVYPLLINSLKPVYIEFLRYFYKKEGNLESIRKIQNELLYALGRGEGDNAASLMKKLSSFAID